MTLHQVGDTPVEGMSHGDAISLIKAAGLPVRLLFKRAPVSVKGLFGSAGVSRGPNVCRCAPLKFCSLVRELDRASSFLRSRHPRPPQHRSQLSSLASLRRPQLRE
jgi:hypothetical protein